MSSTIYNALTANSPQANTGMSPLLTTPSMAASALAPNPNAPNPSASPLPLQQPPQGHIMPMPKPPVNLGESAQGLRSGAPGGSRPGGTDQLTQFLKSLGIGAGNANAPGGGSDLSGVNAESSDPEAGEEENLFPTEM